MNPGTCELCKVDVPERCGDGTCRACHKSLTFEDCVSGSYVDRLRAAYGLPALGGEGRPA
jgi:hypothetical protein